MKTYIITEQQRLEIIKVLDELPIAGKFVRPLANFFEQLQPSNLKASSETMPKTEAMSEES